MEKKAATLGAMDARACRTAAIGLVLASLLGAACSLSCRQEGVGIGTIHRHSIRLVDARGTTIAASAATDPRMHGPPPPPTGVSAELAGVRLVTVSWTAVEDAAFYEIDGYDVLVDGARANAATLPPRATRFSFTYARFAAPRSVAVRSVGALGPGPGSAPVAIRGLVAEAPTPSATPTPRPTSNATPTPTPGPTSNATPTPTPKATTTGATPTPTPKASTNATPTPTPTPGVKFDATPTPAPGGPTPLPLATPKPAPQATPTPISGGGGGSEPGATAPPSPTPFSWPPPAPSAPRFAVVDASTISVAWEYPPGDRWPPVESFAVVDPATGREVCAATYAEPIH